MKGNRADHADSLCYPLVRLFQRALNYDFSPLITASEAALVDWKKRIDDRMQQTIVTFGTPETEMVAAESWAGQPGFGTTRTFSVL